jgi:hypothetical protein
MHSPCVSFCIRALNTLAESSAGSAASVDPDATMIEHVPAARNIDAAPSARASTYCNYDPKEMAAALEKAISGWKQRVKVNCAALADAHGVPASTLRDKFLAARKGIVRNPKAGSPTKLPPIQEQRLAEWIRKCSDNGLGQLPLAVAVEAKRLGDECEPPVKFPTKKAHGLPGKSW